MCSCSWSTDPSPHRQSPPWSVAEAQSQVVYLITASFAAMHIAILSRFEHQWVYVNTFVVTHSTHRNADLQQSKKNVPLRKLQTGSSYGAVHEVMWAEDTGVTACTSMFDTEHVTQMPCVSGWTVTVNTSSRLILGTVPRTTSNT